VSASVLLDRALINPESSSQNLHRHTVCIALDQPVHPRRFEASADTPWGSSLGRLGPRWDHFEEVREIFSLVRLVQFK